MLRDPSNQEKMSISIDDLPEIATTPWHTLHCELVTPMYGGGVVSATVDNFLFLLGMLDYQNKE